GSLYWFTASCEKTKVLSFDLHTETFQVICKSPFVHAHDDPYSISICILDNCLVYAKLTGPPKIYGCFVCYFQSLFSASSD
ncbi:unnamed protein product, partial [Brassica oleracea var. botrytis]